MTTTEHLQKIKSKCQSLLDIAEKRTPGRWGNASNQVGHIKDHMGIAACFYREDNENDDNAAYIASCAGPAEAGWKATIAAIDGLEEMNQHSHLFRYVAYNILAAWPIELLD